jgi:small subunit ribosomal protein S6
MFVLDSGKFATDPQGTENSVREILTRCEAETVSSAPWQDGKLAYPIDGNKKGLHYLIYFKMDGSKVDDFTRLCHLNELVVRHLLIAHEPKLFEMMSHTLAQHVSGKPPEEAPAPPPAAAAPAAVAAV